MQISVTFRHIPSSEALKQHAIEKLEHLRKYVDETAFAHVVLSAEKQIQHADIQINSHGLIMRGKENSSDLYNSIERAVEKIEKQFRRYRDRLKHHQPRPGTRVKIKFNVFSEPQPQHDSPIIQSKEVEARPMMLDEACMQMDLLGSEILVFMNAKSDRMNVLYRKKGQKYGLIEAL